MQQCEIFIHELNLNYDIVNMKIDEVPPMPTIFPNISDVVIWNSLTINNDFMIPKIFKRDLQKKKCTKNIFQMEKWT
jgi:hypothetical protein